MALPPSQTRSCNSGAGDLGDSRRITSINDGTPLAKTFVAVWDERGRRGALPTIRGTVALFRPTLPSVGRLCPDRLAI
jgi:hypothetical protein